MGVGVGVGALPETCGAALPRDLSFCLSHRDLARSLCFSLLSFTYARSFLRRFCSSRFLLFTVQNSAVQNFAVQNFAARNSAVRICTGGHVQGGYLRRAA